MNIAAPQTASFPKNVFAWPQLLGLSLTVLMGCQSTPEPGPSSARTADPATLRFGLAIQTRDSNPGKIQVSVTASDPAVWSPLQTTNPPILWESILSLRLAPARTAAAQNPTPPIFGTYLIIGNRLEFQPQFSLLPGQTYQASFDPTRLPGLASRDLSPIVRQYQVAATPPAPPPRVTGIYPSGSEVPANHLKFYLLFSEPMQPGNIFQYFKLLNARGAEVPEPFRETELWSVDGRRLTLWFHPGRQKTGVNLNVEIGPVLVAGERYTLVIAADWRSQRGVSLGRAIEKPFQAGPAKHTQPDTGTWQLDLPTSARGKLRVSFPEAYDWALLQSQLWVETATGKRLPGRTEIGTGELHWIFEPAHAWVAGNYRLAMGSVLEDLAGNSLARPFEVDVRQAPPKLVKAVLYRPFIISREPSSKP